ncbi:MAG: sigma-54-dependent Fis family transcriptional regulator [Candidatus Krumholzibacteriota bacterium]|nr:sigma-54-dependent Fis family transcriptional regulator [Candidatus Krumholzibacteriota bacterium]
MSATKPKILVADDEKDVLEFMISVLSREPYDITGASSESEALALLRKNHYALLITDRNMDSKNSGINLLNWVTANSPDTGVIIVTSYADVSNAVEAMKKGALDYVEKPFNFEAFKVKVKAVLERLELKKDHRKHLESYNTLNDEIIGSSQAIKNVMELSQIYAHSEGTVLITGETGVGKELIARRIHNLSRRRGKLFVECNTGGIGKEMIRSDLFGHVKGAFTGAVNNRTGKFELAEGGTLFLDEIGEMDLDCQKYLLRVLETRKIERMGDSKPIDIDVRVIAGTNRNLQEAIGQGSFREDIFYRLAQLPVEIPPLRERKDDIVPIAEYFLKVEGELAGRRFKLSPEVKKALEGYKWPGNVRMLKNQIHLAATMAGYQKSREITPAHLNIHAGESPGRSLKVREDSTLDDYHREILRQLLSRHRNNKRKVARILEVTEATIHNWSKKYGI